MKDSDGSVTVKYSGVIYKFPSADIGELRDSTDYLDDFKILHRRMEEDSYLLFRNFLDREKVLSARKAKLHLLAKDGHLLPETDIMEGFINTDDSKQKRPENVDIPQEIFDLCASPSLFKFFNSFFGEEAFLYPKILLRPKKTAGRTGIHVDNVYVGEGSPRIITCWLPLGDIEAPLGPLAVCKGSHHLDSFAKVRKTYGNHNVDRDNIKGSLNAPGHFSWDLKDITDNFGGQWQTTNFRAGDVILFPRMTFHCGLDNTTDRFRISTDFRFQPLVDPKDMRFMRDSIKSEETEQDFTHRYSVATGTKTAISMEEARKNWGL